MWYTVQQIIGHDNGINNEKELRGSLAQSYFDLPRGREVRNSMVPARGAM